MVSSCCCVPATWLQRYGWNYKLTDTLTSSNLKRNAPDIQPERRRNDHGLGGVLLAGGSLEVGRRSEQVLLSRLGVGLERGGGEYGGQAAGGGQRLVGSLRVQKRSNADISSANEERLREKLFVGPCR